MGGERKDATTYHKQGEDVGAGNVCCIRTWRRSASRCEADRQAILEETAKLVTEASMEATTVEEEAEEKSKAVAGLVTETLERSVLPSATHCDTAEWHECFIVPKMKSNTLLKN